MLICSMSPADETRSRIHVRTALPSITTLYEYQPLPLSIIKHYYSNSSAYYFRVLFLNVGGFARLPFMTPVPFPELHVPAVFA